MKQKNKPRNKAFDQIKGFVLLVAVVVIGVMAVQNGGRQATPTTTEDKVVNTLEIISRDVFDDLKRVQVVFRTGNERRIIDVDLQKVVCSERANVPAGYDLMVAGKFVDDITLMDGIITADKLAGIDCQKAIDWDKVIGSDYIASGLR